VNGVLVAANEPHLEKRLPTARFAGLFYRLKSFRFGYPPRESQGRYSPTRYVYFVRNSQNSWQKQMNRSFCMMTGLTAWEWPGISANWRISSIRAVILRAARPSKYRSRTAKNRNRDGGRSVVNNTALVKHQLQDLISQPALRSRKEAARGIIQALTACKGRVGGPDALQSLVLSRTTFIT